MAQTKLPTAVPLPSAFQANGSGMLKKQKTARIDEELLRLQSAPSLSRKKDLGIFAVVRGQIPKDLLTELQREFTEMELDQIYFCIHKSLAPRAEQPAALFVFGPPAVGKSSIANTRATALFGSPENAVLIDGSEFRDVHGGWREVTVHGTQHSVLHADAWDIFKKTKLSTRLKQRVFLESIRDRQHLVIPDCATELAKVEEMLAALVDAGYELHALCMYAPLSATRDRGLPRSRSEGKLWTPAQYYPSVLGSLEMATRFSRGLLEADDAPAGRPNALYKSLALWDNTVFPASR